MQTYSHSQVGLFTTCPRRYAFKHVERVDVPAAPSADIALGDVLHEVIRGLYDAARMSRVLSLADTLAIYAAEWSKPKRENVILTNERLTITDYIATGETMLRRFYERFQPFDEGKTLAIEQMFTFQFPHSPWQMRLKVDRLWRRDDGVVEILDYKTGRRLPNGVADPAFTRQLALYQLGIQATYPEFVPIEVAQYFLHHEELLRHRFTPDELDEETEGIRQDILGIRDAVRREDFPPKEGEHCRWCEFRTLCPAKRHRVQLEAEAGEESSTELSSAQAASRVAEAWLQAKEEERHLRSTLAALREDLIRIASDLDITTIAGASADVVVKQSLVDALPQRSNQEDDYVALSHLARRLGLETAFKLDTNELLKLWRADRLTAEQREQIAAYITSRQTAKVSSKKRRSDAVDD